MKPVNHNLTHSAEEIVRQGQIFVVMLPKNLAVEENRAGWFQRSRIEVPAIGWKQPGPAQRFTCVDGIGRDRIVFHDRAFQGNCSAFNQIKTVCRFASSKDRFAGFELLSGCVTLQQLEMVWAHTVEK